MSGAIVLALLHVVGSSTVSAVEAAPTEGPASHRFVPTLALGLGASSERLELESQTARRSDLTVWGSLGLSHPVLPELDLGGHASVAIGPALESGRYGLLVREDVTWAWPAASWLTWRAGLGVGLAFELGRWSQSRAELGVPLSVTFGGVVELLYRPLLALPLGEEVQAVFGGERRSSAASGLVPLDLAIRLHLPALGF
jgi:hypothetical protein